MIALNKFRELLGMAGKGLSDDEVERIRDIEYRIADAVAKALKIRPSIKLNKKQGIFLW